MLLVTCVLLCFINHARLEDGKVNTSTHISWEEKIRDQLILHYPSVEKNSWSKRKITVSVRFLLKTFNFLNSDKEFEIYSWMFVSWNDTILKWSPADFDGIDSIHLSPELFWAPDITMDNHVTVRVHEYPWVYFVNKCQIYSHGKVNCVTPTLHTVLCQAKLSNWPYDVQTCRLNYTSKTTLQKGSRRGISTFGAEYGTNWNIIASNYILDSTKTKITLTFVVERLAHNLATMYVIPIFVIVILNFTAMAIDFESKYRIYISCFSLLSHYMFLQEINSVIPLNGYETPKVLIFLRASLVMSTFSIAMTFTLKNFRRKSTSPPGFVFKFNKFFLDGSRKIFIWSNWMDDRAEISPEDTKENWKVFSNVLNCLNISIYCIVYPVLLLYYIPRALPSVE